MRILPLVLALACSPEQKVWHPHHLAEASVVLLAENSYGEWAKGTGTLWKHQGEVFITTAEHVVSFGSQLTAYKGTRAFPVEILLSDAESDFAVLRPRVPMPYHALDFKYGSVDPGDDVWYAGNPNHINHLLFKGTYSGEVLRGGQRLQVYQSFAWMGSSGAALVDKEGGFLGSISKIGISEEGHFLPNILFVVEGKKSLSLALHSLER